MARRNHSFSIGEYYHCYNRGTDKRTIFADKQDYSYFLKSLRSFNSIDVLGKLRLHDSSASKEEIVDVISYCLLPNHYHIILREKVENGISRFIQRVAIGYTLYFNEKNDRSGSLFQGPFKSKHITTDQDIQQLIAYVAYNYKIHNIKNEGLYRSYINTKSEVVRVPNSNFEDSLNLEEIVEIIKLQRLELD